MAKAIDLSARAANGVALTGAGIPATYQRSRWLFSFEKNERDNINDDELQALKDYAAEWLKPTSTQFDNAVVDGALQEICQ